MTSPGSAVRPWASLGTGEASTTKAAGLVGVVGGILGCPGGPQPLPAMSAARAAAQKTAAQPTGT
jgi:hypothetical protein